MAVLWNQGLRKVDGRVIDSKGVRGKVFRNVLDRQVSGVRYQARQASGDQGSGNVVDCLTPKSSNLPQHRHDLLWLVPPERAVQIERSKWSNVIRHPPWPLL